MSDVDMQNDLNVQQQGARQAPQTAEEGTARFMALEALVHQMQQQQQANQDTIQQQAQTIANLQEQLGQQQNVPPAPPVVQPQVQPVAQTVAPTDKQIGEIMKPAHPDKFNGDTAKLRKFLHDLRTHFEYYFPITFAPDKFVERIQYAGTRMEKAAADRFEPYHWV